MKTVGSLIADWTLGIAEWSPGSGDVDPDATDNGERSRPSRGFLHEYERVRAIE